MNSGNPFAIEPVELIRAELHEMRPRRFRVQPQPSDVNPVANRRERLQKPNAMVEFDRGSMKVALVEQMVQTDTNLQDALVQVAHLFRRGAPQEFERLVLLEKLAGIEFVDSLNQLGRRGRGAG